MTIIKNESGYPKDEWDNGEYSERDPVHIRSTPPKEQSFMPDRL